MRVAGLAAPARNLAPPTCPSRSAPRLLLQQVKKTATKVKAAAKPKAAKKAAPKAAKKAAPKKAAAKKA